MTGAGWRVRRIVGTARWVIGATALLTGLGVLARAGGVPDRWWAPDAGRRFPASLEYADDSGTLRVLLSGGPIDTRGHPFFRASGPHGRACVTCHQPADSMSLSAKTAQARWVATGGRDPLFAAYDGSNCPTLRQTARASHSLLLDHGLIRIQRPWPPRDGAGQPIKPDFTIAIERDPWGCNSGIYGPVKGTISVYRRPRPLANMKFLLAAGFAYDPKQGLPLPTDPESGKPLSGNLMADGRASTLLTQIADASSTHLAMMKNFTAEDLRRLVDFESRLFAAQACDTTGGALDEGGAAGGPQALADATPGQLGSIGQAVWSEFQP